MMGKKIVIKELSINGHETYSIAMEKIVPFMESKLDDYHVAYCEPMHKVVKNSFEIEALLEIITEIIILPKIHGG